MLECLRIRRGYLFLNQQGERARAGETTEACRLTSKVVFAEEEPLERPKVPELRRDVPCSAGIQDTPTAQRG